MKPGTIAGATLAVLVIPASAVSAQVATWSWTVSDTGNGDGVIEPGESALLTVWMSFEPRQDQFGGGYAQVGPYSILGNDAWAAGTLDEFVTGSQFSGFVPFVGEANNIHNVDHFQYPRWFGYGNYNSKNPVDLFFIRWTPREYTPRTVTLDNGGPDAYIYTDEWGDRLLHSGADGFVEFSVVPAPASAAAFGVCALGASGRRR